MTRYIGLDAHAKSCTFGVIDDSGRRLKHAVVETDAKCLIEFVKTVSRPRYVCLEEGAQSAWLYEVLSPHNDEVIVTTVGQSRGNKDDKRDAFKAAENLRTGSVTPVYKERGPFSQLICVARMYGKLVGDKTRTQNRLKAVYRSRGVNTPDGDVYTQKHRQLWLDKLAAPYRPGAELYYAQLDALAEVEQQASKRLSAEVRKHDISLVLMSCPGIGPVRAAELMGIMVTPYRFRTKRQLWAYSGLSVVMRSTNDWALTPNGAVHHDILQFWFDTSNTGAISRLRIGRQVSVLGSGGDRGPLSATIGEELTLDVSAGCTTSLHGCDSGGPGCV